MIRLFFIAISISLLFSPLADADSPVRDHDIEPEDYFTIGVVSSVAVSPDGKTVAFTETRWEPPEDRRNTDLWVVDTATKQPNRLTFDKANEGSIQWSPDGKFIYYKAGHKRAGEEKPPLDGKGQVWRISPTGGEPTAVTRVKDGVGQYQLSSSGKSLYYAVTHEGKEDEWKEMRDSHSTLTYGHGISKYTQIWKLDLVNWRAEKIIDEDRVVGSMKVSPDERRIGMITTPDNELVHNEGWSRVDVYDAETKEVSIVTEDGWRASHASPYGWLDDIAWSADSLALGFTLSFDGFPTQIFVAEWMGDSPKLAELKRPDVVSVVGGTLRWRGETRDLCFEGDDHARTRVYAITNVRGGTQSSFTTLTPGDITVDSYHFSPDGKTQAVITSTLTDPPDVYLVGNDGKLDRLTQVNPQVDTWKLPQIGLVQWEAPDGSQVEGVLELPPDYKKGDDPLPMVVEIHGGPTSASKFRMRFWIYGRTMLAAKGYAVISPNYRGSTGYGDKFMIDLIGHENDIEVQDILAGVDSLVASGVADADRLGVMGWSNGGFLTNCLITTTDRFKAASSGAGVVDQVIQWGVEDTPGHVINFMKGAQPWGNLDEYRAGSPLYNLHKVKTPTLIHVGENDARVPVAHSKTLYRGLKQYLNVPTELVVYPGEGHGLTTYKHRKAKMEWDVAWFDRYILETPAEDAEKPSEDKPSS